MISHYGCVALGTALATMLMAGCFASSKVRMDPSSPIDVADGYSQNGRVLDADSMIKHLSRESVAGPHVRRAKPLALTASLLAGAGGALVGWPLGTWAGGGEPNWKLAYAGAGVFAAAIPLAIWGAISMRRAVDAHNALVHVEPAARAPTTLPQIVRRGSLLFSESDLSGVSLTMLGLIGTEPKLALRFRRSSPMPDKEKCQRLEIAIDGRSIRPESTYKADAQGGAVRETVQAELDLNVLNAIIASQQATFTICGRSRRLTAEVGASGARFLQEYQRLLQEARADAAQPARAEQPAQGAPSASQPEIPEPGLKAAPAL